jgi:hypothetical protein
MAHATEDQLKSRVDYLNSICGFKSEAPKYYIYKTALGVRLAFRVSGVIGGHLFEFSPITRKGECLDVVNAVNHGIESKTSKDYAKSLQKGQNVKVSG